MVLRCWLVDSFAWTRTIAIAPGQSVTSESSFRESRGAATGPKAHPNRRRQASEPKIEAELAEAVKLVLPHHVESTPVCNVNLDGRFLFGQRIDHQATATYIAGTDREAGRPVPN
jgi:hypothetical protein